MSEYWGIIYSSDEKAIAEEDNLECLYQNLHLTDHKNQLIDKYGQPIELPDRRKTDDFLFRMRKGDFYIKSADSAEMHQLCWDDDGIKVNRDVFVPDEIKRPGLLARFRSIFTRVPEVDIYNAQMDYIRAVYNDDSITGDFNREDYEMTHEAPKQVQQYGFEATRVKTRAEMKAEEEAKEAQSKEAVDKKTAYRENLDRNKMIDSLINNSALLNRNFTSGEGHEAFVDVCAKIALNQNMIDLLESGTITPDEAAEMMTPDRHNEMLAEMKRDPDFVQALKDVKSSNPAAVYVRYNRAKHKEGQQLKKETEDKVLEKEVKEEIKEEIKEEPDILELKQEEHKEEAPELIPEEPDLADDRKELLKQLKDRDRELRGISPADGPNAFEDAAAELAVNHNLRALIRDRSLPISELKRMLEPGVKGEMINEMKQNQIFRESVVEASLTEKPEMISMTYEAYNELQEKGMAGVVAEKKAATVPGSPEYEFYTKVEKGIELADKAAKGEIDLENPENRKNVKEAAASMFLFATSLSPMAEKMQDHLLHNPAEDIRNMMARPQMNALVGPRCDKIKDFVNKSPFVMKSEYNQASVRLAKEQKIEARKLEKEKTLNKELPTRGLNMVHSM